jgi:hypothetical protein
MLMRRILLAMMWIVMLCGIVVVHVSSTVGVEYEGKCRDSTTMTFFVGASPTAEYLQGVGVLLVGRDGKIHRLGETDLGGNFSVAKGRLREGVVVLFCKERYFCGAFRLSGEGFLEHDEWLIHLAPIALM